ncbi:Zn(2)-Cys(6) binuclear cluster domain-containing protein [Mycena vulgaris]|nr:Zn(2)-Cys(6) binuclear cluster domain-containing protein [Mycena vulgaris]
MQQSFPVNPLSALQKGKACVNCRRRKIKCDGGKPICGPCSRYSAAFGDCEYTEAGPSNGQMLEEQISILQGRIEELEKPKNQRLTLSTPSASSSRGYPVSPSQISPSNTMGLGPLLNYFYLQQTSGSAVNQSASNSMPTELPFIVLQALVHNFLHNATCFGFFLDAQAFHDAVTSPNGRNLPPVLLNVLYLWGVHLSKDERITVYEPAFLAHALRSTASSLSGTHPRTVLHSVQASVLLAYYFIRNARFLEGKYHTSAAASIAISAGLHRIRGVPGGATAEALPPPSDAREEGERISAFWAVLTLDNCWAGMDGSPSNIAYGPAGVKIDTPWPLETRGYRPHLLPRHSSATIARFLGDVPDDATSEPALHAKAGILFESATRLGARYRAHGIPRNDPEFAGLDRKIDTFTAALPAIQSKALMVVHTLAHVASIQLHKPLVKEHAFARTKALASARSVVDILVKTDIPKVGLIDPVLAPLWASTSFVIISEIGRRRGQGGANHTQGMVDSLNTVIAAMQIFAPQSRLTAAQLESVRQAYNAAQFGS